MGFWELVDWFVSWIVPTLAWIVPTLAWIVPTLAIGAALYFYIKNSRWNFYRYLAELYYEILKIGVQYPDFLDCKKTRKYKEWEKSDPKKFLSYAAYAHMCWAYAEDIYDAKFDKKRLRKLYAPTFKRFKELHGVWLCSNEFIFPMEGFIEFVKSQEGEDYCPDDQYYR